MLHYRLVANTFSNVLGLNGIFDGYDITPKNNVVYDGIIVNKLVIVNHFFVEKILKKKIKRKLEVYLEFLLDYIDSDSEDGTALYELLDDVSRYKDILRYKYMKYLGEKYIDYLLQKIELLEYEMKVKLYDIEQKELEMVEAKEKNK